MTRARRYFQWQFRLAKEQLGQRVLEVGCGLGNFTRLLMDRELVVAIDAEQDCVAKLRRSFDGQSNLVALHMDVTAPDFLRLAEHNLDSIVCLNVLEHVRDHRQALCNMRAVLHLHGKVVLIVPAFQSLYGPIDHNLGHHRRYSKESLTVLADSAGFVPVTLRYMNSFGFLGWWWNAHVIKRKRQSAFQVAVFDALVVPLLSRLEDRMEPPFGQSIFVVLVKRD
ncbi:MAG: methyltransferase domain-containing protein [Acidobacteria bacterium]|nr:methyltransferase domain-containing protein [Acidobacteriota bacterium]